ncbi:MAG TPA: hypothetical protein DIV39_07235 [Verrucomicrobiales bacterium]|nr:hypothetical protein [Verrucomicrobiales bacterium]|tara:strand:+ start:335 stop:766 length:432 start_codon:yes stop_codon:yes gene_type:complete
MNIPGHFKFLLDSVEETARNTEPILHIESSSLWDDIVDSFEDRYNMASYWLFSTRWMREQLLTVMQSGSPRALLAILSVLCPDETPPPSLHGEPSKTMERRIASILLPVLMLEIVTRVRNAASERLGPYCPTVEAFHPEDHRD